MLALEIKKSGGKLLPHSELRGGVFLGETSHSIKRGIGRISRRWDVGIWTGLGWPRIQTGGGCL